MNEVTVSSGNGLRNEVRYDSGKSFVIDEPESIGGSGTGPDPYTLLLAALGGCTSMTITLYARRKGWALTRVHVHLRQERIHVKDCADCATSAEGGFVHRIERTLQIEGDLTEGQRARLREIAAKCPVHKTLSSEIVVVDNHAENAT
jgi:putative redox protein